MGELKNILLTEISISKNNPRKHFEAGKMQELVDSIKEKGIIQPIVVRPKGEKYEVVCGERRLKAAQEAGLKDIPAIVRKLDDKQALEFQVVENLQREDVHPLEEAEGYETLLKKHGYKTVDDIAAKVGKSRTYIYGRMKLCELIPENRKLFYDGKFSPSVALLVARVPAHLQKEAGKSIAQGQYRGDEPKTQREAREYIHEHFMLQLKEAQFDTKEKGLSGKESCLECLKRTGSQKELFADVQGPDICTDPVCFEIKKNAHTQRTIAKLKAEGKEVMTQEGAKKIFRYEHDESPENTYINVDEKHTYGSQYRELRQILKATKDAKIIYAVQPYTGKIIEMVEKMELPRILKNAGIKSDAGKSAGQGSKELSKAKKENRIREASRDFWINKVSTAKDRRCMNVVTLDMLLHDLGWSGAMDMLKGKIKSTGYGRSWSIPKLYELGDEEVQKLIIKVISKKSEFLLDNDLEFLSGKLGFNVTKDYMITETYLQAMTKDQLIQLAVEIGLRKYLEEKKDCDRLGDKKKTELIDLFLKKGFDLKGLIPKEMKGKKS
jgi:ParB/RepB/Spo0J family partition protein